MNEWILGLLGGILIGLSATLLLWSIGRIAGISGIVNGVATAPRGDRAWRIAFMVGVVAAGGMAMQWMPNAPGPAQSGSTALLVVGGLLVGFGTRMSNGCTTGHGVCGLGRLSARSLVAVMVFMAAAIATVYVRRHLLGIAP